MKRHKGRRNLIIQGIGKNGPIHTNRDGGKQSSLNVRFDLLDPKAIFALAYILDEGAKKYSENNWRKVSQKDHINHALMHIFAHLNGDTQDDHLEHAFCRMMMALGTL